MTRLLMLLLLAGLGCAKVQPVRHARPGDYRLRYVSLEEIQEVTLAREVDVRFEGLGQGTRVGTRVPLSEGDTIRVVLVKVLGENRTKDWYATLLREKEMKTILPWFEKGSIQSLEETALPGDLIIVHQVKR